MTQEKRRFNRVPKSMPDKPMRAPALMPVPEKLVPLIHLANLLPEYLRHTPAATTSRPDNKATTHQLYYVRDWWDTRDEKNAISSMFHLRQLVSELPRELQAFVLHDDYGRYVETPRGRAPLFDPDHLQPYENIHFLSRPSEEIDAIVTSAKERVNIEEQIAKTKISSPSEIERLLEAQGRLTSQGLTYRIGDHEFIEMSLPYLAGRAKERFFFILAAEEILDALTGPDTKKKLDSAQYVRSSAIRSRLFVNDDEVHASPPILFSFVVGIQASRVRRCEICGSYFWAGRKDKTLCSAQCSATRRKRKQRGWYEKEGKWKRFERDRRKENRQTKNIERKVN